MSLVVYGKVRMEPEAGRRDHIAIYIAIPLPRLETSSALVSCRGDEWTCLTPGGKSHTPAATGYHAAV